MPAKTIIEPFRIKTVEPLAFTTEHEREKIVGPRVAQGSLRRLADRGTKAINNDSLHMNSPVMTPYDPSSARAYRS